MGRACWVVWIGVACGSEPPLDPPAPGEIGSSSDADIDAGTETGVGEDTGTDALTRYLDRIAKHAGCTVQIQLLDQGLVTILTYDALGYQLSSTQSLEGEPYRDIRYTWELDERNMPTHSEWIELPSGSYSRTTYDQSGHAIGGSYDLGRFTELACENTYDGGWWVASSCTHTHDGGSYTIDTTYNACEDRIFERNSDSNDTEVAWTYRSGCSPERAVWTFSHSDGSVTQHFDGEGRLLRSVLSDPGQQDLVSAYTWSCP